MESNLKRLTWIFYSPLLHAWNGLSAGHETSMVKHSCKHMRNFGRIILFIGLLCSFPETLALASDMEQTPLRWGQSMQEVIRNQHIVSYVEDHSKSLLSGLSVHLLMTKGGFLGNNSTMLYSFMHNKLIEYCITIEIQDEKRADATYEEIKLFLNSAYQPYRGFYFDGIEDRFIDDQMKTGVLLIRDKKIIIYLMEFEAVTSSRHDRISQYQEDLERLVIQ